MALVDTLPQASALNVALAVMYCESVSGIIGSSWLVQAVSAIASHRVFIIFFFIFLIYIGD